MSEATQQVAGLITGGILKEAVDSGYGVKDETIEAVKQAEQPEEVEEETPAPPPDPVDEIVDSLKAQAEEKIEEVVEEEPDEDEFEIPDFEAQAEAELLNEEIATASDDNTYEPEWEDEPVDTDARRRAIIAEKKAAFYENLTAKRERKKWEAEADKHFPMWRARGDINATSRRAFLKQAKESNDAVKPFVKEAVKTREEQLAAERAAMKAEVKAEANAAWGKPTVAQVTPTDGGDVDWESEIREARRNQDLAKVLGLKRAQREAQGGEE